MTRAAVIRDSTVAAELGLLGGIQSVASSLRVELSLIDARDFVSCPVALFPASSEREIADKKIPKYMLELASHIVETKSGHSKPEKFEDHYEDAIEVPRERAPAKVINLMDALRRSVDAERGGGGRREAERRVPASRRTPKKAARSNARREQVSGRLRRTARSRRVGP